MSQNKLRLYTKMRDIWQSMREDIQSAKSKIHLEQYIMRGKTALEIFHILKQKAKSGVEVKVMIDVFGSWPLLSNRKLNKELKEAGVELKWYNPVTLMHILKISRNFYRTHRKILVVDSSVGHISGAGIDDTMENWIDLHGRISDPEIAGEIDQSFLDLWNSSGHGYFYKNTRPLKKLSSQATYKFLSNSVNKGRRYIYYAIKNSIQKAQKRIWLAVPYFIPHTPLEKLLIKKAEQGLDVKIILPQKSDLPILDLVAKSRLGKLLMSNIQIFLYNKNILHAKVLLVDNSWGTFGSMNWDSKSFYHNLESNLAITNPGDLSQLNTFLEELIANSVELKYQDWKKRSFVGKIGETIFKPFQDIL